MIVASAQDRVATFLAQALLREGAEAEPAVGGALFVVLPEALREALALPEAACLRPAGEPGPGEIACPLEGAAMQVLLDRARGRGLLAGARLPARGGHASGRLMAVKERITLLNSTFGDSRAEAVEAVVALLEFGYEARSEERADGHVFVAVPTGFGAPSLALASAVAGSLGTAVPEEPRLDAGGLAGAASSAATVVEPEVRRRLEPFFRDRRRRLEVERERVVEYHDRLAREARGRGARDGASLGEAIEAKRAAVLRQREERLADVAERHAVETTFRLESALVLHYDAVLVRLLLRRRRREIPLDILWDPFLRGPLTPACAACAGQLLAVHACDEEGHLTCGACARPCPACARIVCRACRPAGCGCS